MYRSSWFLTATLVGTTIVLVKPVAAVKSVSEVEAISRSTTVEIAFERRSGQQFQIQILTTGEEEEENRKSGKRGADGAKKAKFSHPTGISQSSDSGDERPSP